MYKFASVCIFIFLFSIQLQAETFTSNPQFCTDAIDDLADTLFIKFKINDDKELYIDTINSILGDKLRSSLAEHFKTNAVKVYLAENSELSGQLKLTTRIDDLTLSYQRINSGLFKQGNIKRTLKITLQSSLISENGRFLQSESIPSFVKSDIISNADAKLARRGNNFYSPIVPPSLYQKMVEPALITVITGGLVYLFFASR